MSTVSLQEQQAMARLLAIMNGQTPPPLNEQFHTASSAPVELAGAGQITDQDKTAMKQILLKLEQAVTDTSAAMLNESTQNMRVQEALATQSMNSGVRIGIYKIEQQRDESRIAGKQFYNVINSVSNHIVAHELSLYEAAHALVRYLNNGKYFNSPEIIQLLEAERAYTSHKIDAVRYHRMMQRAIKNQQHNKVHLMETRKQASMDRAMVHKQQIKNIHNTQIL